MKSHKNNEDTKKTTGINVLFDPPFISQWLSLKCCCLEMGPLIIKNL